MIYTCMPNINFLSATVQKSWSMLKFDANQSPTNKPTDRAKTVCPYLIVSIDCSVETVRLNL